MTMEFAGKDGELRLYSDGFIYYSSGTTVSEPSGTTYYFEVLFTEMDFTGPITRPRTEETLIMDRGNFDTNAHYIEGNDEARYAKIPISFSCKLADTVNTRSLYDWLEGVSAPVNVVGGSTTIYSPLGTTTIDGNTLPKIPTKNSGTTPIWNVETLWDGTSDYGIQYNEVYFTPGEQTITESADGLTLSCNGMVLGDVTRITAFTSGTSILSFV